MTFQPQLKALIAFVAFGLPFLSLAQNTPLLVNNGAMFFVNGNVGDSALVYVDGTVANNDSIMVNLGRFIITGDFVNNAQSGGFDVFPTFIEPNDGVFEIYGDWENNGVYNAGNGRVRFMDSGFIQGDSVTRFHDLELVGPIVRAINDSVAPAQSGVTIDVEIDETGTLDLDEGEFATNFNTLWVYNPSTGAIIREECDTCGFVSSLDNGDLAWVTNQSAPYVFPTGSSIDAPTDPNNFRRYRPLWVVPETSDVDTFHVRFVNQNATNFGLPISQVDTTICYVNPWWYHRVKKDGGNVQNADIVIQFNPFEGDENYNEMANWSASNAEWEGLPNTSNSVANFLPYVLESGYDDYQELPEDAYILAFSVPEAPEVDGETALCASVPQTYTVPDNGSTYEFTVSENGTIVDQTDNSVTIIWNNDSLFSATGVIEVSETVPNNIPNNGGCVSRLGIQEVEVWPLPVADFTVGTDTNLPGGIFVYDVLEMQDASILTSQWEWDFDDGTTSADSLPFHTYNEIGDYNIELIVTSGLDCKDTLVVPVSVVEGAIVPNVFTPNGDGTNDVFDIRTSNVGPFKIEIYNRWGNVIFETTSPQISWDGSTLSGVQASSGTYFYVISDIALNSGNAIENNENNFQFKETGWVQLIR